MNGTIKSDFGDLTDDAAVHRFQEFLRIPTITVDGPNGSFERAIQYLTHYAKSLHLDYEVHEYVSGYPVFVISIPGIDPSLPSILFNSHYDVVPVMMEYWHYPPFDAMIDKDRNIIARGAQDMKCVAAAYMEAILRLMKSSSSSSSSSPLFHRSIHLSFMPDEETGGINGMARWIHSDDFKKLNVGFALDEGLANPSDTYTVFYGERAVWWTRIKTTGPTGHGSRFIANTANEKLIRVINKLLSYRKTQVELLDTLKQNEPGCHHSNIHKHTLGDVVTINLTMLKSGVTGDGGKSYSINVIPMTAEAGFDIRIPPSMPLDHFEQLLQGWCKEADEESADEEHTTQYGSITYDFFQKVTVHSITSIDPQQNSYWKQFSTTLSRLGRSLDPQIFPAGTDGRYLREIGIPVLGFSPIRLQPILLHDHDERLSIDSYLEGVAVYQQLIPDLANMK